MTTENANHTATNDAGSLASSQAVTVSGLRCEQMTQPIGIDARRPLLSWRMISARRGVRQTAYQVQVDAVNSHGARESVWNSGCVSSDASIGIAYEGPALESRCRYVWRVRVWDEHGEPSAWSAPAHWEMGLLEIENWQAQWIEPVQTPAQPEPPLTLFENFARVSPQPGSDYSCLNPCQYVRRVFSSRGAVRRARIYATAHGVYRLQLNGVRVGDLELAPEPTAYEQYLQVQAYDVTELIGQGDQVLGAIVADGWYAGRIGLPGASCQYGDRLGLLVQLEIDYEDGRRQIIGSDAAFRSTTGPLVYSDLFIGERYDARLELGDWHRGDFDARGWQPVELKDHGFAHLVGQYGEPLRVIETIAPRRILRTPRGEVVVDLGQNIAGKIQMRVTGPAGAAITLDYFEELDADGNALHVIAGRNKDQRDIYVLKGAGVEAFEPAFTLHGFRYVRVTGYPGEPTVDDFTGRVVASDLTRTGTFACSDERLNRLQSNIVWSQKGNLVSIPTDCPQRERAGFTGDAQVFIPTACFNMDVAAFFTRWLRNVQIEQRDDGQVPTIVPYWRSYIEMFGPVQGGAHTSAAWGDACIIVPWTLYQAYGDRRVLAENYPTMTRWLAYVQHEAETGVPERLKDDPRPEVRDRQRHLWNTGFHFGDWLIPSLTAGYNNPFGAAELTKEIAASCYYAYSTALMAEIASTLGNEADRRCYAELNEATRRAFAEEYVLPDGRLTSHYQGMYVLALKMGMVPEDRRGQLVKHLVDLIRANGNRLDTGFVSVPFLMDALCDNGRADVAYDLLFQNDCPSWLYEVDRGATTIWETWDAIRPDGQVATVSFNHYSFGCVGDWLYRYVAGLGHDQPGYRHVIIEPHLARSLTHAAVTYQSVYGEIVSAWERVGETLKVRVVIPPNTTASVRLPGAVLETVSEGQADLVSHPDITSAAQQDRAVIVEVASGAYTFVYPFQEEMARDFKSASA